MLECTRYSYAFYIANRNQKWIQRVNVQIFAHCIGHEIDKLMNLRREWQGFDKTTQRKFLYVIIEPTYRNPEP